MAIATDSELLQRWAAGRTDAGSKLVERHYGAVRTYVRARFRQDVDDLTQSTFLICLTNASQFRGDSELRTFLLGIAHRLILAAWRSRYKPESSAPRRAPLVEDLPADNGDDLVLRDAMERLPPDLRTAIALSYWAGLTEDEIAQSVGCPRGTIASRLRRGKRQLRELLQGSAPSGALVTSVTPIIRLKGSA